MASWEGADEELGRRFQDLRSAADFDAAAEVSRLFADRTRLAILALLAERELSVGQISRILGRPNTGISQHLAKLRMGRLVVARKDGSTVHYALANEHVASLLVHLLAQAEHAMYERPPHHLRDGD